MVTNPLINNYYLISWRFKMAKRKAAKKKATKKKPAKKKK